MKYRTLRTLYPKREKHITVEELSKLTKKFFQAYPKLKCIIDEMKEKNIRIGRFQSKVPNLSNKPREK